MKLSKSIMCRLFSCILMLAFVMALFPFSAFALENGVRLRSENYLVDDSGNFTENIGTLQNLQYDHSSSSREWLLENNTVDLWVYSDAMAAANEADGSVAPYAFDEDGNKYELKTVAIKNERTVTDGDTFVLMTSSEIDGATSKAAYQKSTATLTMDPYQTRGASYYFVSFGWSLVQKTTNQKYQVSYDLNLPTDIPEGSRSLYPVTSPGSVYAGDSDGSLGMIQDDLTKLAGSVYSNQNYTVSDFDSVHDGAEYTDFLVFNYSSNSDYYTFDGWTVKDTDDPVYQIGQSISGDQLGSLADDSGNIKFVGKWTKIDSMTDAELQRASDTLYLNALTGVGSQSLIKQSVGDAVATSDPVTLREGETISYTVETALYRDMISNTGDGGMSTQDGFANLTYQVKIDSNLEFANLNDDGTVSLTFTSNEFGLTGTNIKDAVIDSSSDSGTWTITFDPENVPIEDGSLYITVSMKSLPTKLDNSGNPIKLSGLDFKAKADQYGVVPKIETSANVVGSIDLHKKAWQTRAYYWSVNNLLSNPQWKDYFKADEDTPTAVAHASQFINYKLSDINLATDNVGLEANTVVANSEDDKISYPALDKKVQTGTSNGQPIWDDATTAAANDTVSFQLNSNVPQDLLNYITYDDAKDPSVVTPQIATLSEENRGSYPLVFHDQMAEKLVLNSDSFVVKLGDDAIDSKYYIVTSDGLNDDCSFEVSLDLATLYADKVIDNDDIQNATPITVTYTATLASDAEAGQYLNTAWVTYSDEGKSEESTVSVTTYGINIFKYDQAKGVDGTDAGLAGAEFMIYGSDAVVNGKLTEGAKPIREEAVVSGEDGHVIIDGLDAGTYYLVETKAPTGYVKSDKPLEVIIPDKVDETTYRAAVNFANSLVPHTGGTGTVMYTVGGLAIIVLAGILLVVYRKSRKKQDR